VGGDAPVNTCGIGVGQAKVREHTRLVICRKLTAVAWDWGDCFWTALGHFRFAG
jgi:hypothetical protein